MGNNTHTGLTLALMAGLPGAGKTTLSIELGRELGWHVINKDRLKEVLMKMGWEEKKAGDAAYEISFDTVREVLTSGRNSVIFDTAALHTFILENVKDIVCSIEYVRLKIILCVADRDLRHERIRNRPAQITNIHVDPESISEYLRHFKHLLQEPDTLTLKTNYPLDVCIANAEAFLVK